MAVDGGSNLCDDDNFIGMTEDSKDFYVTFFFRMRDWLDEVTW